MTDDVDPALETLRRAVTKMLDGCPGVEIGTSMTGDGKNECLVLTVESAKPCRYVRVNSTDSPDPAVGYAWLWSSYRAADKAENSDGRGFGDLVRTLDMIRHWIVDGMAWQDVPEFRSSPDR